MGRALWRSFVGDLRHRRLQTALLLVVVAVAAAGITAGLAQQRSAADRWDAAFARANGAHVALFGDAATLRRVAKLPEVTESAGPAPTGEVTLRVGGRRVDEVDARGATTRPPAVGRPLLFAGRWLDGASADEVVVERSLAQDLGVGPGERIALEGAGGTARFRVVGVALDLLDCFYPRCDSATVWVPPAALTRLDPGRERTGSLTLLRLRDPAAVGAFESAVQARYGTGVSGVLDWQDTRDDVLDLNRFFGAFLAAFGVFLLLAAGLVILSAVSSRVLARYREIGMLKAVGFTPRELTVLVLGENLVVAAAGALVGALAGSLLAPLLQLEVGRVLERGRASFPPGVLAVSVVIVLVIVGVATLVPAWRAGRVPASRAIARGAASVSTHPSRLAGAASRARLGPPVVVGLKDSGARPLRAWMTVLTLAVTVLAVVASLGLRRTVDAITSDPARAGDPYDLAIDPAGADPARVEAALRRPDVRSWSTATSRRGAVGDQTFQVRVLGGDAADAGYLIRGGRMMRRAGEAIVGYGLLDRLGLQVGDSLDLEVSGGTLPTRIVGWYWESEDSGEIVQIPLAALREVEPGADAGGYLVRLREGAGAAGVVRAVGAATGGRAEVEVVDTSADELDAFGIAFTVIALLVLAVALVNLVATTVLGIRERARDIGILKTVGFTPRQVGLSVAAGAATYAVAAVVIGVPVGIVVTRAMLDAVGRGAGIGPGIGVDPTATGLLVVGVLLVGVSAGLGALVARRAAAAPVVEVLRAE